MIRTIRYESFRRAEPGSRMILLLALGLLLGGDPTPGGAEPPREVLAAERLRDELRAPDGIHVLDGSYVLDHGELHVNITNHGLIGSQYTQTLPYSAAASGQWPGGSGHEYLWGAGLWIGGVLGGQLAVTTGQPERELRPGPDILDTIYEARGDRVVRPTPSLRISGRRPPWAGHDDDDDGVSDEDMLNGRDDDGDGLVDEDFGQIGDQMFTCTMRDDTPLGRELYPDHAPLGLAVVQRAAVFGTPELDDAVMLDFTIANAGIHTVRDIHLGLYVDCDIQRREAGASEPDDLAGFYNGAVRGRDGSFHRLQIGWMRDADPDAPLPGVFGAMLLGHDTDPLEVYAPHLVGVHSFRIFATSASGAQDGEPLGDAERYALMADGEIARDRRPDRPGDLKFMFASGPFGSLPPGRSLSYRVALVVGTGMEGMLRNALRVSEVHRGRYLNVDGDYTTGGGDGRETLVCLGDYPPYTDGSDPIYDYRAAFMDEACVSPDPIFGMRVISPSELFTAPDGRRCIYVNADNCEECFRRHGEECTIENGLFWVSTGRDYQTGTGGGEAYVPWLNFGAYPPAPPHLRVVAGDNAVELFWDDVSEFDVDPLTGVLDFESYRVWRVANWIRPAGTTEATGPEAVLWGMLAEYDLVNEIPAGVGGSLAARSLGRNTGLEAIRYRPACLDDPAYAGLAAAMQAIVDADVENTLLGRPPLRAASGAVIPGREPLLPWEHAPAVLDTFFAVAERAAAPPPEPVVPKRGTRYYRFRDDEVHNGFRTIYAVVAADHSLAWTPDGYVPVGYGVQEDPANNRQAVTPTAPAQTAAERQALGTNIYVYPNPATREALAEFQQQPPSATDATGVRVMFTNLPAAHNTIEIFTASGDLVATLRHDGTGGRGSLAWNLMSRNGQEVVSGVYFYVVTADDSRFAPFRGRFVVIR